MSEKTKPYEIREHLLHLAREILSHNAQMNFHATGDKEWKGYTTEDVIKEARKLNNFIAKG